MATNAVPVATLRCQYEALPTPGTSVSSPNRWLAVRKRSYIARTSAGLDSTVTSMASRPSTVCDWSLAWHHMSVLEPLGSTCDCRGYRSSSGLMSVAAQRSDTPLYIGLAADAPAPALSPVGDAAAPTGGLPADRGPNATAATPPTLTRTSAAAPSTHHRAGPDRRAGGGGARVGHSGTGPGGAFGGGGPDCSTVV